MGIGETLKQFVPITLFFVGFMVVGLSLGWVVRTVFGVEAPVSGPSVETESIWYKAD